MTKQDAIRMFGGVGKLAKALGVTSQAVSLWADGELPVRRVNEITGAAIRAGIWPRPYVPVTPAPREAA